MEFVKAPYNSDVSEASVINGCLRIGVSPPGETLVASLGCFYVAEAVSTRLRMNLILLPPDMLRAQSSPWAIIGTNGKIFWSLDA